VPVLKTIFPPLYQDILPPEFDVVAPDESKTTCGNCPMCVDGEAKKTLDAIGVINFGRETKCCTYQPAVPNYLVGAVFADPDPAMAEGQRRLRKHLATRMGVLPWWLTATAKYYLLWEAARREAFGRAPMLKCPYLLEGNCTIWRHRDSVCSTFFCKHDNGEDGKDYWRAVNDALSRIERALVSHLADLVDPTTTMPPRRDGHLTRWELEDVAPPDEIYASWWQGWVGREEEFYVACYEQAKKLVREDVLRLGGEELAGHLERMEKMRAKLPPEVPERARLASDVIVKDAGGTNVIVYSYSRYDPTVIPKEVMAVLREVTLDEPIKAQCARKGVELGDEEIGALVQLRVLSKT